MFLRKQLIVSVQIQQLSGGRTGHALTGPMFLLKGVHWEEQILEAALGEGAQLVADEQPSFSMHWSSIREFWEVSCYGDAETEVTVFAHAV